MCMHVIHKPPCSEPPVPCVGYVFQNRQNIEPMTHSQINEFDDTKSSKLKKQRRINIARAQHVVILLLPFQDEARLNNI
jgi:hypothetical protein